MQRVDWPYKSGFDPANLGFFYARLFAIIAWRNLRVVALGFANDWPIFLIRGQEKRLVAAGFHGEEQAGPWGLLRYLERAENIGASFLPMVNPSGFRRSCRLNDDGDSPNTGYIASPGEHLSAEGQVLKSNVGVFKELAEDGFLTLHEQTHSPCFYLYAFERELSAETLAIRRVGERFFPVIENGPIPSPGSGMVHDGVVLNEHDGTFEDWLFQEGVPRCLTTETPLDSEFSRRVEANEAIIHAFVGLGK
jgi:hypothetical protein